MIRSIRYRHERAESAPDWPAVQREVMDALRGNGDDMAKFVMVKEIAERYGRNRSSFGKFLRRNGIETEIKYNPVTGQNVSVVPVDALDRIERVLHPEDEIVSLEQLNGQSSD